MKRDGRRKGVADGEMINRASRSYRAQTAAITKSNNTYRVDRKGGSQPLLSFRGEVEVMRGLSQPNEIQTTTER